MKQINHLILIFFIFSTTLFSSELALTDKELSWIKKNPIVKVSNEDDWAPFDFSVEGKAQGYSVDVVKLLAKKIGIEVKFVNGHTWSELLIEFDKNNIDLMHVMSKTKERIAKYSFSKKYMPWKLSYFIKKNEKNINSAKDFDGKKVAAGKGWSTTQEFKRLYPKAIVIEYKNTVEMIEALSTSKVDICIDNNLAVSYIMSENIITNIKNGGYIKLKDIDNGFHFVSHKNSPELASIFEKAFDTLSINEKLNLQEKWFYQKEKDGKLLTKEEIKWIKENRTVLIGGELDWAPFDFVENGTYQGITNDYLNLISEKTGLKFKVETGLSWEELVESFKNKKIDILPAVYYSDSRAEYGSHTHAYYNVQDYIFVRDDSSIKSMKDFRGKTVAVPKGYITGDKIQKIYPDINILRTRSIRDSISAVLNGEADGTIEIQAVMSYILKTNAIEGIKVIPQNNFESYPLRMLVQKNNDILFSIINKAIQAIDIDEQNEISNKWINIYYNEFLDKQTIIYIIITFLLLIFIFSSRFYYDKKINQKLQLLASTDPMTKLYNRRYFTEMSESLLDLAKRNKTDTAIIMLDIDKFKNVNDIYGHKVGDDVIVSLSLILREQSRKSDIVSRWGGEEFVILLPETNVDGALVIAEKIRKVTEDSRIKLENKQELKFTISLGISKFYHETDTNIEASINRADEALYEAKESGRNKVCV